MATRHLLFVYPKGRGATVISVFRVCFFHLFLFIKFIIISRSATQGLIPCSGGAERREAHTGLLVSLWLAHTRRGDALLWRGLLSYTQNRRHSRSGTQGHKEHKCVFKWAHSFAAASRSWLWVFQNDFVTRRKVALENKTLWKKNRRERVFFFFYCQG